MWVTAKSLLNERTALPRSDKGQVMKWEKKRTNTFLNAITRAECMRKSVLSKSRNPQQHNCSQDKQNICVAITTSGSRITASIFLTFVACSASGRNGGA